MVLFWQSSKIFKFLDKWSCIIYSLVGKYWSKASNESSTPNYNFLDFKKHSHISKSLQRKKITYFFQWKWKLETQNSLKRLLDLLSLYRLSKHLNVIEIQYALLILKPHLVRKIVKLSTKNFKTHFIKFLSYLLSKPYILHV